MLEQLVDVICDTNFLIYLATKRIKNLDLLNQEIGQIDFVVPKVVLHELKKLQKNKLKHDDVSRTLDYIKKFKIIDIDGSYADMEILKFVTKNGGIVGTLDKKLKQKIKKINGSILTLSKNKIILES